MTEENLNELSISEEDDVVDPWNVTGKSQTGIDYEKLISKYITLNKQSVLFGGCKINTTSKT